MTCGARHPMHQHRDLACELPAGHPGDHRARVPDGDIRHLDWSPGPGDDELDDIREADAAGAAVRRIVDAGLRRGTVQ